MECFRDNRPEELEDESVGAFFSRRVSKELVDRAISGVLHGIYAGDAYQLSAKSLFPEAWYGEKETTSVILGLVKTKEMQLVKQEDFDMFIYLAERAMSMAPDKQGGLDAKLRSSSVFTLKRGLQSLTERMESLLKMAENVTFKTDTPVRLLKYDQETQKIEVYPPQITTATSRLIQRFRSNLGAPTLPRAMTK